MKTKSLFSACLLIVLMAFVSVGAKAQWWTETPPAGKVGLHRLVNIYTGKHIAAPTAEAYSLSTQVNSSGFYIWSYEGKLGWMSTGATSYPIYRYFKGSSGDHVTTLSATAPSGYTAEGIMGYAHSASGGGAPAGTVNIHAYYRVSGGADHLYTNNYSELGGGSYPWAYEGVGFVLWL